MRTLAAIQAILAAGFILFGLVTLFGIGITGLLFLVPGAVFAATAGMMENASRAATAMALAADAMLAWMAVRKLAALMTIDASGIALHQSAEVLGKPGVFDYLMPSLALLLTGIALFAVIMDWRTLRKASWF